MEIPVELWMKALRKWLDNGVPRTWYSPEEYAEMRKACEAAFLPWLTSRLDKSGHLVIGDLYILVREYHVLVFLSPDDGALNVVPIIGPAL